MKYYLKENFRFLYADGQLYNENNEEVYTYSNVTLFFPQINLYKFGDQIGTVKKRFTWFLNQYDIYHHGVYIDSIHQQFRFINPELLLEQLGWIIRGDFLSWHYEIYDEYDQLIARADQELFRLTQRFYVEIYDEDNEELLILLILAINQFDKDRRAAAASRSSRR